MKPTKAHLFVLSALLFLPVQSPAEQAAEAPRLDQVKISKAAQVIQKQTEYLVQKTTITFKGKGTQHDVPMKQFDCQIVDNTCACSMFYNAGYEETEYRNLLIRFYPARINKVVYEPDRARLTFSGKAGFMESASEDKMLVSSKDLEKDLISQDETMPGYISISPLKSAPQISNDITGAMKDLVSLCGGSLADR